ncbi:MAG: hypothetical protein ACREQ4_00725 [Candidatus Binataceae bacterium]
MIRKLALVTSALVFAVATGFATGVPSANAAKRVDCSKVMSELHSGKKAKAVAADLKISTSSVYRCKRRERDAKSSSMKTNSTATKTSSTTSISSTSSAPKSSSGAKK